MLTFTHAQSNNSGYHQLILTAEGWSVTSSVVRLNIAAQCLAGGGRTALSYWNGDKEFCFRQHIWADRGLQAMLRPQTLMWQLIRICFIACQDLEWILN
jgi:hypothetical protein